MTGRARLPGGEPRKASQRNARRSVSPDKKVMPVWRASMPVLWKGRAGIFRRDVGDGELHRVARAFEAAGGHIPEPRNGGRSGCFCCSATHELAPASLLKPVYLPG